jgi:hypothetical protein
MPWDGILEDKTKKIAKDKRASLFSSAMGAESKSFMRSTPAGWQQFCLIINALSMSLTVSFLGASPMKHL